MPGFVLNPADIEHCVMPTARTTMHHIGTYVGRCQFHSGMSKPTGPVHLHHLAYSITCMGSLSSNVGLSTIFNTCWTSTIRRLLVTFHPPLIIRLRGLDIAAGSTISLRSQSYLGLRTLPSIFTCFSKVPPLGTTLAMVRKK